MIYVILWLVCGAVAAAILGRSNRAGIGCLLGVLLGPLGVLGAFAMKESGRRCQFCRELVHHQAIVCPHCQREIGAATP